MPPPDRNTPPENPYLPLRDIGAPQFVAKHTSWDGRGATIAIVESTPDLLCPELQTAKLVTGEEVRKVSQILNSLDAEDDVGAPG